MDDKARLQLQKMIKANRNYNKFSMIENLTNL